MEFKELLAAFAAKYGIDGLGDADGAAELDVDGVRVELLDDPQSRCALACAEIGLPPPDADGTFGGVRASWICCKGRGRSAMRGMRGNRKRSGAGGSPLYRTVRRCACRTRARARERVAG